MVQKCVHKGCGKAFDDPDEPCVHHPGPPVFHEGQKGWACCKPRVLTFDEFLSIPPCTTGKHSTISETTPKPKETHDANQIASAGVRSPSIHKPTSKSQTSAASVPQAPRSIIDSQPQESDSDDPSAQVPPGATCKRRACNASSDGIDQQNRREETCIYHPGQPIFHEGTKGWTCCKKRVLEFDEFLNMEGCKRKSKHLFIGKKMSENQVEEIEEIRHDYYQTSSTVIASLFLKKIVKERSKVEFQSSTKVSLDLHTQDNRHYKAELPLFGQIDASSSTYKIMGTKLELALAKADGLSWATLRGDEQRPNEIIQVGKATSS